MKKTVFILLLTILSVQAYSQKGDLTVGAKGGYVYSPVDFKYNGILYGFDVAYHLSDPLEIAFTGLMNPSISRASQGDNDRNIAVYSANIDFRLYLIHQQTWATGPALGGQYYIVDHKNVSYLGTDKKMGFNIGWHFRIDLTDNLKLNAGWRYTNVKFKDTTSQYDFSLDASHHLFYLGLAYTFETK